MVPLTLTNPRIPKYSADFGQTTTVQPPALSLFCTDAERTDVLRLYLHAFRSLPNVERIVSEWTDTEHNLIFCFHLRDWTLSG